MYTFTHAGKLGDILFSLYFCIEITNLIGQKQFNYNLLINKKISVLGKSFREKDVLLSKNSAEFIRPLLESSRTLTRSQSGKN